MMAKRLAMLAALLGVLLVGATARTTVTSVEIDDDENQGRWSHSQGRGECRQQIQQQGQLRHCQEFLREQARGGGEFDPRGRWGGSQREFDPREREFDPRGRWGGSQREFDPREREFDPRERWEGSRGEYGQGRGSQYGQRRGSGQFGPSRRGDQQLVLCCNELRQLDNQCRCEGLSQIVRRQVEQHQGQQQFRGQPQYGRHEEVEEIARIARNLPQQCGVGPQYCQIRAL